MDQASIFWGLASFCAVFAFTVKKREVCLVLFGAGVVLAVLYGGGLIAQEFFADAISYLWRTLGKFGTGNILVSTAAGSFANWLGGQYLLTYPDPKKKGKN